MRTALARSATAAAHSLREETDALSDLIAQFRVGDTEPVAIAPRAPIRKTNQVHSVQQQIASVFGGGRSKAGAAAAAAAFEAWEDF